MTEITLEFLQDLLKDDYPDVTLQEFEGAPGSKRGDNYTSMVYRITLKGVRHVSNGSTTEDKPWQGSVIYKCLPESMAIREAFKSDELFCNEVVFYNKIWPALLSFQSLHAVKKPFTSIPKCYLARNDCILLKDLKQFGFVMPDRREVLSLEQTYVLLKELAHFHALSLAMKCNEPERFHELVNAKDGISEVYFTSENNDYFKKYYSDVINFAISMVEEELKDSPDKEVYLDKFRRFCTDQVFETIVDLVAPSEPLSVICHGDSWTNNFLFRYEEGAIAEMCIVDFQLVRYGSPTLDLVYVMFLCLNRRQRSTHLSALLRHYSDELYDRVYELSQPESFFCSSLDKDALFDLLQEEFKQKTLFGLGIALDMYPIMTCDSNEAPNVYQSKDSEASSSTQPVLTSNAACRRKMTDLLQELVDGGIL